VVSSICVRICFTRPSMAPFFVAGAVDDRRVVLVDRDALGLAEVFEPMFSSLMPRSSS
jgi:hypothetical protein